METAKWKVFNLEELLDHRTGQGIPYFEFLRVPNLSSGIYFLPAGAKDLQSPHDEDEVYYVISGSARMRVEGQERVIGAGSLLYVAATSAHSFIEIEEDMTLLVFFASGGPSAE